MNTRNKLLLLLGVIVVAMGLVFWLWRKLPGVLAHARPDIVANKPPAVVPTPPHSLPTATQPSTVDAAGAAVRPRRKFADMSVMEANAILVDIGKQDLALIFQVMLDAKRVEYDSRKQLAVQSVLAGALQTKTPNSELLKQMWEFITNKENPRFERDLLLGALGSAATKETVDLLIRIATTSSDQEMKQGAIGSLGTVGRLGGAGEKLSPALERVWRESTDQGLLTNVALEMAKIGAPSSIELLLSATLVPNGQDKVHFAAAQGAMEKVYLPNAVPPLAARLADQSPASETAKLAAPVLVRIGDATAAKAVVTWLQGTAENAAPLVHDRLFQETRTPAMLTAWKAALDPAVPFRNEDNRTAIRAGLAERSWNEPLEWYPDQTAGSGCPVVLCACPDSSDSELWRGMNDGQQGP